MQPVSARVGPGRRFNSCSRRASWPGFARKRARRVTGRGSRGSPRKSGSLMPSPVRPNGYLQIECAMRGILRGNNQLAQKRGRAGAPAQRFFGGNACDVRIVVILGKMREHDVSRVSIESLRIGEELADGVIGEVSRATHHALLDVPGIRPNL